MFITKLKLRNVMDVILILTLKLKWNVKKLNKPKKFTKYIKKLKVIVICTVKRLQLNSKALKQNYHITKFIKPYNMLSFILK